MRRTFALAPSTIALIVVALLASSAGIGVSFAGQAQTPLARGAGAYPRDRRPRGRAERPSPTAGLAPCSFARRPRRPDGCTRRNANSGDGARNTDALGVVRAPLDLAGRRTAGPAVDAREHGVSSPGQPAPSSRAPPIC